MTTEERLHSLEAKFARLDQLLAVMDEQTAIMRDARARDAGIDLRNRARAEQIDKEAAEREAAMARHEEREIRLLCAVEAVAHALTVVP